MVRRLVALSVAVAFLVPVQTAAASPDDRPARERCPDSTFTCITLTVPLDHTNPADPRTIDVVFGILPATGERRGMFVTAVGGPGYAGLPYADSYTSAFQEPLTEHFDIVFFDQRGMGMSGQLECVDAAVAFYQADFRADTPEQETALAAAARTFAEDCAARLPIENLPFYRTTQAVEDLEAFRQFIGDDKIWLYGESYGTQYAQTYAAMHGDHVAGMVIDGNVDLTLEGTEFYAEAAQSFNDVLVASLDACAPACDADAGADTLATYDALGAQLEIAPATVDFPLGNGTNTPRTLTFSDLETAAAGYMYGEFDRMLFARAVAAAGRGDLVPVLRLAYSSLGVDPQTLEPIVDLSYSDASYYAVDCTDYEYFAGTPDERAAQYLAAGDYVDAKVPRLGSIYYGDLPCAYWPAQGAPGRPAPLVAPGIPTLVLTATADPITPYQQSLDIVSRLADGYLVVQEGGPHVIFGRGNPCPDDLVTAFLVSGTVPASRVTTCPGTVADPYEPLAPTSTAAFGDVLDALLSAESELFLLPEYWYWDGFTETPVGCPAGGSVQLLPDPHGERYVFRKCAFTPGFVISGHGRTSYATSRTFLDVRVSGDATGRLSFVDDPERGASVKGVYDGERVNLRR